MNGLTFSTIISIFIPLSFYCCLTGTVLTLIIYLFSIKYNELVKPLKRLATIFAILWMINVLANVIILIANPKI